MCFCYQEMYDKTQLSRGEGLDPNPLAPGEYIEHQYRLVTCNNGLPVFPMLNVRKTFYCTMSETLLHFTFVASEYWTVE